MCRKLFGVVKLEEKRIHLDTGNRRTQFHNSNIFAKMCLNGLPELTTLFMISYFVNKSVLIFVEYYLRK